MSAKCCGTPIQAVHGDSRVLSIALAVDATGAKWGSLLVKAGTIAGTSTVMMMTLMGQSRIFFVMSRDGMLPAWAGAMSMAASAAAASANLTCMETLLFA